MQMKGRIRNINMAIKDLIIVNQDGFFVVVVDAVACYVFCVKKKPSQTKL